MANAAITGQDVHDHERSSNRLEQTHLSLMGYSVSVSGVKTDELSLSLGDHDLYKSGVEGSFWAFDSRETSEA